MVISQKSQNVILKKKYYGHCDVTYVICEWKGFTLF